tara:strand:+ start:203 stop:1027 length:825 start_codon:yes stop_codon:yes gene_type:complete
METNVNYAAVGIFVITLVAATILSIIWLSSGLSVQQHTIYQISMNESVSGLNIDSPVEFNGVSVGSVESIDIDPHNPQLVELLLNIKSNTPISKGTVATLKARGVTGVTFISLTDTSDNLDPLVALKGKPYPVIRTEPSLFMRVDTALTKLSDNLHDVTISIRELLDSENQQNIKDILMNVQKVTGSLSRNNERMNRIIDNTEKVTRQFTPLVRSTTSALQTFEMQTLPATYRLINNLDNMTRSLSGVAAELKQNPSVLLRGSERQPYGPGEMP